MIVNELLLGVKTERQEERCVGMAVLVRELGDQVYPSIRRPGKVGTDNIQSLMCWH